MCVTSERLDSAALRLDFFFSISKVVRQCSASLGTDFRGRKKNVTVSVWISASTS